MSLTIKPREKLVIDNTPSDWVDYKDGVAFELYGIAHPLYIQAQGKLEKRMNSEDLLNLNEDSLGFETQVAIVGRYLVKDWTGIDNENGEKLEVTADNFVNLVVAYPELFGFVLENSVKIQKKQSEETEATKKKPSSGTSGKKTTQA